MACVSNAPATPYHKQNSSPLNPAASEFQPSAESTNSVLNVTTVNELKFNLKYSPATYVELLGSDGVWRRAVALFDSGSDVTLIKKEVARELQLERQPRKFTFGTAGGGYCSADAALVSLWIRRCDKPSARFNISAIELERPAHKIPCLGDQIFKEYPYLESVQSYLPQESTEVDILIGYDYASLTTPVSYLQHTDSSEDYPQAAETLLGWYILGPAGNTTNHHHANVLRLRIPKDDPVDTRSLYEADVCGVKPTRICACSDKEVKESYFLKHVKDTIRQTEEGRVEVSLPWKEGFPSSLNCNRDQAMSKLHSLERRLEKSNLADIYEQEMSTIISEFAEPVPEEDVAQRRGWYLNHFPVLRPGKSTSCRVVWNSAAVYDGLALNDGLFKGPDLLNNLFMVLVAWRSEKSAVVGDIRKMFNQVQLAVPDRAYHRFLWRNKDSSQPPKDYQWKRLPFGDKPAPDLSISALRFLADKLSPTYSDAAEIIKHNCYMDDLAFSVKSNQDALRLKSELNIILSSGKFAVKGWHSNSKDVDEFPDERFTDVLGLHWNKGLDVIQVKVPTFAAPKVITKRTMLSCIAKLWDPLGALAPVTVSLRILMQSLWSRNLTWDEAVDEDTASEFVKQMEDIDQLQSFWFNRCIISAPSNDSIELHGFCDGGEKAYGAAVWMRVPTDDGFHLNFVAAKSFVSPLKKKSIPRIELLAAVILTRLIATICDTLPCSKSNVTLWTDNAIVLHWLKMPVTCYKPFVSTRIQEINETFTDTSPFRYVKSALNPADALTKPIAVTKLANWHEGPDFLKNNDLILTMNPKIPFNIDQLSQREEKKP